MTTSTFIHGLWGDHKGSRPTLTLNKTKRDVRMALEVKIQPTPLMTYTFGRHNSRFVSNQGLRVTQLSKSSILNFHNSTKLRDCLTDTQNDRRCPDLGRLNWGVNFWRHKLYCLKAALEAYDEIVWLDWDIHQIQPLPDDFWKRLRKQQPLQMMIRCYVNPQCQWRTRPKVYKKHVPHGGFIYCRDINIIEYAIKAHEEFFPRAVDELALAWTIEKMLDGGKPYTPKRYQKDGYLPYCYFTRGCLVCPPESDIIFQNFGR